MADDKATERPATVGTGFMDGNPVASLSVYVESDTIIEMATQVMDPDGNLAGGRDGEINAGNYHCSVIRLGTGGVTIFIHREDLVRLLVPISEHLDMLDRADTTDRRVAINGG
jgi:hypothetical protein